jgi:hypothetical protein
MWEREASLHDAIVNAWESLGNMQSLSDVSHALDIARGL